MFANLNILIPTRVSGRFKQIVMSFLFPRVDKHYLYYIDLHHFLSLRWSWILCVWEYFFCLRIIWITNGAHETRHIVVYITVKKIKRGNCHINNRWWPHRWRLCLFCYSKKAVGCCWNFGFTQRMYMINIQNNVCVTVGAWFRRFHTHLWSITLFYCYKSGNTFFYFLETSKRSV